MHSGRRAERRGTGIFVGERTPALDAARTLVFIATFALALKCGDDSSSGEDPPTGGRPGSGGTAGVGGGSGEGGEDSVGGAAGAGGPSPEETLLAPCTAFCEASADPMCTADAPLNDCVTGCVFTGSLVAECVPAFESWLTCSIDAGFECDESDMAVAEGCDSEDDAFTACVADL